VTSIRIAETDGDIARCFPVMRELRTHLAEPEFVPRVRRQQAGGYRLAYLEDGARVCAVAGFRLINNLLHGRVLYVDDLVTDSRVRSQGHGKALLEALMQRARDEGCQSLELDSGVQRFEAHRFYLANRMIISSHHFLLTLGEG
jgi:GNAT superfamily N-acetyltransferase